MLTIHFFKGLPGSGKSTEAERMVREKPGSYVRVNKDSLRAMLHAGHHSKGNERFVLDVRNAIVRRALLDGKHVIVDDTNFDPKHRMAIDAIAEEVRSLKGSCAVEERFFDVPLEECIARDLKRQNSVGERVIRRMYNQWLRPVKPEIVPAVQDRTLPHAIIVDIDGTLAKMKDRGPFEWDKVGQDELMKDVRSIAMTWRFMRDRQVIICSGRDEVCRALTEEWLRKNEVFYDLLLMRPTGSNARDTEVKEQMYREHIEGKYYVDFVLDDRDQVVRLWRDLGLRCLQVADGDF